jgi:hypothetical protein
MFATALMARSAQLHIVAPLVSGRRGRPPGVDSLARGRPWTATSGRLFARTAQGLGARRAHRGNDPANMPPRRAPAKAVRAAGAAVNPEASSRVLLAMSRGFPAPRRDALAALTGALLAVAPRAAYSTPPESPGAEPRPAGGASRERGVASAAAGAGQAPAVGDATARGRVVAVQVVAAGASGPATDAPRRARIGEPVTLYAVLTVEEGAARALYSDAPALVLGGRARPARPLARAPAVALAWNRIEPAVASMSNGDTPAEFHFAPIDYRATPIASAAGRTAILADVRPTLTPDHGRGVGTMRYQVVAVQGDRAVASAGPEARRGPGAGGLTDAVLRVSIRRDDTFLGHMTELYGQPYIWASEGLSPQTHQSERLEGADCADLMIYGQRRLGNRLPYTWTGALPRVTSLIASGVRGSDGVYRDPRGRPLPFPRVGDLLLFPRHVGALAADRGVPGVLDDRDVMMHTLFDSPREQPIAESGYAERPVEVRRFRAAGATPSPRRDR